MNTNNKIQCESCSNENLDRINISRFIDKLDSFYRTNDYDNAKKHLDYWQNEAEGINDDYGLLTILNEKLGLSRRIQDVKMADEAINKIKQLIKDDNLINSLSCGTILVNMATTMLHFSYVDDAFKVYDIANKIFTFNKKTDTYEYASLLNNMSSAYAYIEEYDKAEEYVLQAYDILSDIKNHDAEIAVSLINLAHIVYDRDENDIERVEKILDIACENLLSKDIILDDKYAFAIEKCIPSLKYFKRDEIIDELLKIRNNIK